MSRHEVSLRRRGPAARDGGSSRPDWRSACARIAHGQSPGVAALEFALAAPLLLILVFMIINLGDLAWTYNALRLGVVGAARSASVATTKNLVALGSAAVTSNVCPTQSTIQSDFSTHASPPIPSASVPSVTVDWGGTLGVCSSGSSGNALSGLQGGWVAVSATYTWQPLIGNGIFSGIPLDVIDIEPVLPG